MTLAGGNAGTFVDRMNAKARQLGLNGCRFYNAHGLPPDKARRAPKNTGTAREMAFLASRLLEDADAVRWASTREDRLIHQKGVNNDGRKPRGGFRLAVAPPSREGAVLGL